MARYLDPKVDLTFKKIFGQHPDLLINFLNAVMPFEQNRYIETVEYLPSELIPDNPLRKYSIVDVRCTDNHKRQFIIEMQSDWEEAFMSRILFNAGKAYVRQLDKGRKYNLLQPVYTLVILNDSFDHKTGQYYHHYRIVNIENSDEIIEGLEFVLIEIPKFRPETVEDRKRAVLWLRFLKEVGEDMKALPPEMQENEYIRTAAALCEESAFTPEELAAYDGYWDWISLENTRKYNAQVRMEKMEKMEREKEKMENALKEMENSLKESEATGEHKKALDVAKKALKMGMPEDDVTALTGLSKDDLKQLES